MSTQQRKALEKENRRQVILQAAEELMRESGYNLNIDAVAVRTQLAGGTIYLYFNSKEEILAALTLKSRQLLFDELSRMALNQPDPLSAVKGIIWANYAFYKNNALHYDLVTRYEANPPVNETEELQQATQNIRNLVIGLIDQAKAAGQIRSDIATGTFSMYT